MFKFDKKTQSRKGYQEATANNIDMKVMPGHIEIGYCGYQGHKGSVSNMDNLWQVMFQFQYYNSSCTISSQC